MTLSIEQVTALLAALTAIVEAIVNAISLIRDRLGA